MLGSLLPLLTASAALLLLPASVGLLRAGQHAHMAPVDEAAHRSRLALAATLVGLGSAGITVTLGGAASVAPVVAGLLAGSVLAWSRDSRSWAVRGVVVWSLLSTGAAGALGWLAHRVLTATPDVTGLLVASAAWLVLLLAVVGLLGHARATVARKAVRGRGVPGAVGPGRVVPWLVTALVAAGLVVAVGAGAAPDTGDRPASAGSTSGDRSTEPRPVVRPERTTPRAPVPGTTRASRKGVRRDEPGADGSSGNVPVDSNRAASTPEGPFATAEPTASPSPEPRPTKTPGYAKEKPNRPEDAPAPGPRNGEGR